jgi:nicotinamidase/pyrazinamidase
MANVIFWDVDTQHDFIVPDGKLYIEGAEKLAHNLKELTQFARGQELIIVATVCDHTAEDEEISEEPDFETTFPPHCMRNTPGQRKIPATAMENPVVIPLEPRKPKEIRELVDDHDGEILIQKNHFDVFSNPNTTAVVDALEADHVILYGVALDVCDRMAVEGFLKRGDITIHVVTDAVQAIQPKRGEKLLEQWSRKGVRMTTTEQILEGYLDRLK